MSAVLVAGDTHGYASSVAFLVRVAAKHGLGTILCCGDFGFWPHTEDGKRFLRKTERLLASAGVTLVWVDGNHENHDVLRSGALPSAGPFLEVSPHCFHAPRGVRWTWSGVRFLALGGAVSVDRDWRLEWERKRRRPRRAWWPEETIGDDDVERACADGATDVLVAHDCPWGAPIDQLLPGGYKNDLETKLNRDRVREVVERTAPTLVLHGHYHQRLETAVSSYGRGCPDRRGTLTAIPMG